MKTFLFLLGLFYLLPAAARDVVLLDAPGTLGTQHSVHAQQLDWVSRFYGLEVTAPNLDEQLLPTLASQLSQNKTIAVVITPAAAEQLDAQQILKLMQGSQSNTPLLLLGVSSQTAHISNWSGGAVTEVKENQFSGDYQFAEIAITQQLAGQAIRLPNKQLSHLLLNPDASSQVIIQPANTQASPSESAFFIQSQVNGQKVYIQAALPSSLTPEKVWRLNPQRFTEIAPLMLVLREHCADYCWHSKTHYANFTIDDPWLTQPYGLLDYQALLKAMKKTGFHTSIGFIPWNYDRSEWDAVHIFRQNPEYYSLVVHGNNHDHREFYKYQTSSDDPWPAKPLALQDFNLRQALARMEKFKALSKLDYERVMIFPHNIAPAETLKLLKRYNFLSTFNAENIPLGSQAPEDPLFYFRVASQQFSNFTSFNRIEPEDYDAAHIAMNLFLDNPLLFFEHVLFFADGTQAFNKTAQLVNQMQPDIRWGSLGRITEKMYLQRQREDGHYDVQIFSPTVRIENKHEEPRFYYLQKAESLTPDSVIFDHEPLAYQLNDGILQAKVEIPGDAISTLEITYKNDLAEKPVDISRDSFNAARLRYLSDFRDIHLTSIEAGRWFIRNYYGSGAYQSKTPLMLLLLAIFLVFLAMVWGLYRWLRKPS
ncbi:hypothetical protein QUF61_07920 [Candidatus Venteria ishoeyi]|uniref:hypothetical protein n=1 Tax=Candidatus Venteria ishoeyi TaxID=1899563 RepID=UPI0025A54638|nr:hypothetical protein [Candidatus Venteria ishoeyi]MDM8546407.1 hypothetical protein [Candidatus Venteria ishoeyi]